MSHVVTIKTEVRDPAAIRAACDRLHVPEPVFGEARLFSSSATGWGVQLPEWRYPMVVLGQQADEQLTAEFHQSAVQPQNQRLRE